LLKRPNLKSVLALATSYPDTAMVHIGLYDDGDFSVGTDYPDEARFVAKFVKGRDARKSFRKALDALDIMIKEASKRKIDIEGEGDESDV